MLTSSNFTSGKDFMKKNFRVVKMFLFAAVLVFAFSVNGHAEEAGSQNPAEGTTIQEETTTEQEVKPVIKNGLVEENGKYYFYKDGKKLKKVWKTVNGKKYYFKKNGQAATGSYKVKKKYYIFNEKGVFKKYKSEQPVSVGKRVYFVSFLRMLIVPLIALVLIKGSRLANLSADAPKIMLIVFLAVITPSASTVTQMCQVYGNDSQYASAINVVTTLSAIITMPVMVLLFENFVM